MNTKTYRYYIKRVRYGVGFKLQVQQCSSKTDITNQPTNGFVSSADAERWIKRRGLTVDNTERRRESAWLNKPKGLFQ